MTQDERFLALLRVELDKLFRDRADKDLLTMKEAAHRLSVSISKLKLLIRANVIQTVKLGGRRMIPMSEVRRVATPTGRDFASTKSDGSRRSRRSWGTARLKGVEAELAKLEAVQKSRRKRR